jgi:exosome complex exonuclease RRP6
MYTMGNDPAARMGDGEIECNAESGEILRPPSPSLDELLSQLMTALATGARAVQGLPLGDEFEYQSSFPEFRRLMEDSQETLLGTLLMTLDAAASATGFFQVSNNSSSYDDAPLLAGGDGSSSLLFHFDSLDDPLLYETCSDLCDALLEQTERSSGRGSEIIARELLAAQSHAQTSFGRLLSGIVEMEKPQEVFSFGAGADIDLNSRTRVFEPPFLERRFHAKHELDWEALKRDGHGLETRFGESKSSVRVSATVVAPSHHLEHPYLQELQSLQYQEWELETLSEKLSIARDENLVDSSIWIDTPEALVDLKSKLEGPSVREIAVDLEAHSYRSFAGMICLIQISFDDTDSGKPKDYLIDPFPVWNLIHDALGPTLANPNVVKIFHGADSDIAWLQRDFGLFIINLFDTGQAARALKLSSFGFAHVLQHYVDGARADKSYQLSDWRQRPLPEAMKEYAIIDTHYLLDIFHAMKYDLSKSKETSIEYVLEKSRKLCTIRYSTEPFYPEGYRSLTKQRGHKTELNSRQEEVLKELWDWRDQTARHFDESQAYVCTNTQLLRLAMACPSNLSTLQSLMQPMPPLLIRNSTEILTLIQNCLRWQHRPNNDGGPPSSAFFKPAVVNASEDADEIEENRQLMSPVLGTEALYLQAGWISPTSHHFSGDMNDIEVEEIVTTSATEDDADDEKEEDEECKSDLKSKRGARKPRRGVAVHEANQNYQSQEFTTHSLQLGRYVLKSQNNDDKEGIIDGLGPVHAIHSSLEESEEAVEIAKSSAAQIHTAQESRGIGLMSSAALESDEVDDDTGGDEEQDDDKEKSEPEEFVIPRSIREIYHISNRNRRNKKNNSPGPPEPKPEEVEELAKAEAVLTARLSEGKNYIDVFPVVPSSPKRQRTKSLGAASLSSSDEAGGHDSLSKSREEDVALMKEIGWIDSKDEIDNMIQERQHTDGDDDDSSEDGEKRGETPKPFDYSMVGPIGAFAPIPSANPFFAGAAMAGGPLNQQFGKLEKKKSALTVPGRTKSIHRQTERPEKREGRAQAYKNK